MSPVWVKLGDFGASKWIQAPAATTLHTQVVTASYGAPEVLGLDSNCESSDYTNSVDIWSLGCVIYEVLVGTNLFDSWYQVPRYLIQKQLFLEEKLKQLPTPADHVGTSLLKSMLSIQPDDRPTAAEALNDLWLVAQPDLVEWYKLDTEFFQDYVRHTRYVGKAKNRNKEVKKEWSNCGELGRGGFSVIYKQIEKTTGQYRAVKAIDKGPPLRPDHSTELLAMAKLAKVCVLAPEEICSAYYITGLNVML